MTRSTAPVRRLSATVLALALTLATLPALLVLGTASPARAAATEFTGGTVSWGIKASWRRYIGQGSQAGDGATIDGWDGNTPTGFTFPVESGSFDPTTSTTTLDLAGYVHFQQWYGVVQPDQYALDTKYSDLTLTIGPAVQELRGTHTGYLRDDPGGELHEDVDVVLATFDLTGATTDFASDRTTWTDIPTVAGAGFSIYPAGAAIDPLSIDYPGPGGMPDLQERFAQPGVPVLTEDARWSTGSTTSGTSGTGRTLQVSPRGDVVYAAQITPQTTNNLVVQALDATTLAPVGTPYQQPLAATGTTQRFLRTAVDPATDTLFYLTGRDGTGGNEVTAHALHYDRPTGTFTHRLVGAVAVGVNAAVGGLAWNVVRQELASVAAPGTSTTAANPPRLLRFARAGDSWAVTDTAFGFAPTDTFPGGAVCACASMLSTAAAGPANLAVLGDGSYLLATGTSTLTSVTPRPYVPAQRLQVGGDGRLTVTSVLGTEATGGSSGTTLVVPGPGGSVYLHGFAQDRNDIQPVTLQAGVAVAGAFVRGPDALPPAEYSLLGTSVAFDAERDLLWALDLAVVDGAGVKLVGAEGTVAGYSVPDLAVTAFGQPSVVVGVDGSLYVPIREVDNGPFGFARLAFGGIAPAVTTQPQDVTVDLATDEASRTVTFEAAVDPELGGDLQWQVRLPGTTRFTDVEGSTAPTLSVPASPATDGRTFRAVVTNGAGRVASDEADLTVTYAPRTTTEPRDLRVTEGANALFTVEVVGNPVVDTITWQRRVGGFWQDVEPDDEVEVDVVDGVASLRLTGTETDQSGSRFRARATSAAGTGYSRVATLTVEPAVVVPPEGLRLDGVVLDWTGSEELQSAPPFGGNNYFSAGTSDGTQATYLAGQGDVAVLQVAADGTEAPATWATRGSHVGTDGHQLVRLSGGDARLAADGSATVSWTGAFSVNFYAGLVPFTVTDPVLTVAADGTGTLVGDLTGYSASMENPEVKTPMAPVPDVTISTFAGVDLDPAGRIEITPEYDGVALDVPTGQTPQVRAGAGWGSWPQEFVDVHFTTGLSSYWYSSGGAADPKKRPAPFQVDFADAAPVAAEVASTTVVSLDTTRPRYGEAVTATVTVSAPGTVPTGPVTLATPAGPVATTLVAGRTVVRIPGGARPGAASLTASYGGAAGIAPSEGAVGYQVAKAEPRVRLRLKKLSGRRAVVHVVVSVPGVVAPGGEVVVSDGRRVLVAKVLRAKQDGRLRIRLPRLDRGQHLLRASVAATDLQVAARSAYRTVVVR